MRSATGKESRTVIATPSATSAVRGTDFRISLGDSKATTAEVIKGVVDVSAMHRTVSVKQGQGTKVSPGKPPLKPVRLLEPPVLEDPEKVYRSMPVRIGFKGVEGAVRYRFILTGDADGRDVIMERILAGDSPLELSGLEDGTFYLQGRSIDRIGLEGPSSDLKTVVVKTNPLPPFVQEPSDGGRHAGKTISFRWMKVLD
ncbi:hypothetical protein EG829_30540, partial [bacterium]|nr:hypothetical protein [bacterium]